MAGSSEAIAQAFVQVATDVQGGGGGSAAASISQLASFNVAAGVMERENIRMKNGNSGWEGLGTNPPVFKEVSGESSGGSWVPGSPEVGHEELDVEVGGEDEAKQRAHLDPDARHRRVALPPPIWQCALSFCTHQSTHALVQKKLRTMYKLSVLMSFF
jgi:hypothetical protein